MLVPQMLPGGLVSARRQVPLPDEAGCVSCISEDAGGNSSLLSCRFTPEQETLNLAAGCLGKALHKLNVARIGMR